MKTKTLAGNQSVQKLKQSSRPFSAENTCAIFVCQGNGAVLNFEGGCMDAQARESEFGKGLVICLVKFSEHVERLSQHIESYKRLSEKHPEIFSPARAIEIWANGASDHLYEIEVPAGVEWDDIRAKVQQLKDKGLEMGHGFTGKTYTIEDCEDLFGLTREIALLIDKKLGLDVDEGRW